jgi:hypothetical protein
MEMSGQLHTPTLFTPGAHLIGAWVGQCERYVEENNIFLP